MKADVAHEDRIATLLRGLWSVPDLSYLLHEGQEELRRAWRSSWGTTRIFCVRVARRYGKSRWACVEAVEEALRTPGAQVRYAAPTAKMVKSIIEPHMRDILRDCPEQMAPRHYRQDGVWRFPNGSEIHVAGCDNGGADRLRGTSTHLGIVDEAGFVDDLDYVVQDVLLPQTLTTDGRLLLPSTPAKTPAHPFTSYCARARVEGHEVHRTIFDAPHIPREKAEEYIQEAGGMEAASARREYLAEEVVDEELAVVPEFTRHQPTLVGECELPEWYVPYTVADFGFHDLTAVLFAYWHFMLGRVVVVDELVAQHTTSTELAPRVLERERELWGERRPRRYCDSDAMLRADLARHHGLAFGEVRKDDAEAALNALRRECQMGGLLIHPRCRHTIEHLRSAIWNKSRTSFERSEGLGHFDCVDAAKYLVRHVARHENPMPDVAVVAQRDDWHVPPQETRADKVRQVLRPKRRR